ncbi:glutamine amidotransferase [Cellvibrio sp. ARAG 10.3]|uniref:glutamine amidotransferase n=1 Tax=Cellvibrio sp. ARAG 10.3 TaxID=3451358 RepID=UPI003F44926B
MSSSRTTPALFILKVGTTFPATAAVLGDFDDWTRVALGDLTTPVVTWNVQDNASLPEVQACAGVIITGSHAMVTDHLAWSVAIEDWLPALVEAEVPILGVCYGHQLLAQAMGGEVGYHPQGKEVGTREIELLPACAADPLFRSLPPSFLAHTTHAQTVLHLPPGAVRLAANLHEPNHAFRLGARAWGVQFHPEYTPPIMRAYIEQQAEVLTRMGQDVARLLEDVSATPFAAEVMTRFAALVEHGEAV